MAKVKMVEKLTGGRVAGYDPRLHGISATLLGRYKSCRQRALLDLLGWTPRLVSVGGIFGLVVHDALRHVYDYVRLGKLTSHDQITKKSYIAVIDHAFDVWRGENPRASAETVQKLEHVRFLVETVLPLYFRYHARDFQDMIWGPPEEPFVLPFTITTARYGPIQTFLKGRVDGTFGSAKSKKPGLYLLETKTKSRIDAESLVDMLPHDLQVKIYFCAMMLAGQTPTGLLYNVIRRPGLKQGAKESFADYTKRVIKDIEKQPDYYFLRFRIDSVSKKDLDLAKTEVTAIVTDFIRWWAGDVDHYRNSDHCENKYGRCEFLGTLCGGADEGKPNPRFYKRKVLVTEGDLV